MEWQKIIYDHEENPPSDLWSRISAELDEEPWIVRKNLGNLEISPPTPIWQEISSRLGESESKKRLAFLKLILLRPVRIAAAAVVAGALIFAVAYFINNPQLIKPSEVAANIIDSPKSEKSSLQNKDGQPNVNTQDMPEQPESISIQQNKRQGEISSGSTDISKIAEKKERKSHYPARLEKVTSKISSGHFSEKIPVDRIKISNEQMPSLRPKDVNTEYVTITAENGSSYRVSAKLRNLIHYMQGADNQNADPKSQFISEHNYWQNMFSEWKKKASLASFVPNSGNFFDIIELMQFMQQNK